VELARTHLDIATLRRAVIGVSGIYAFGIPLTLLANILLARFLSVEEFGIYGVALSLVSVLSIPLVAGMPSLLTREVAGYVQSGALAAYRGITNSAYQWVLGLSAVFLGVGGGLILMRPEGDPYRALAIALLLLPLLGMNAVRSGIMKGLGYPVLSEAPTQLLQPVLLLVGFLGLQLVGVISVRTALLWYLCANLIVFSVAFWLLIRRQPSGIAGVRADYCERPRWIRAVLPFAATNAVWTLTAHLAILMLGMFGQTEAAAAMRVAERGAMLISLPLMFVNATIGPHVVASYRGGESEKLAKTVQYGGRMAAICAVPVALVLMAFGLFLISITFGSAYADIAYRPMLVLVAAQTASVLLGPAGVVLMMTGREKANLAIQIVGLAVFAVTAFLLIPPFGAVGAAIGAGSGILLSSILAFMEVRRKLGFPSWGFQA